MLSDFINNNHYAFHDSFDTWQEAIKASCQPLLDDGSVEPAYVEQIIDCVNKFGPYIVIMPQVAMPHAAQGAVGVNKTTISFMKVEQPVHFEPGNDEKDARLFFVLAASDPDQHLQNISNLSVMLCTDGLIDDLLIVTNLDQLKSVATKYNL